MFEFFNPDDESVGKAYSLLRCQDVKMGHKHTPHPYTIPETNLGPYMCSGYPMVPLVGLPEHEPKTFVTTALGVVESKIKGTKTAEEIVAHLKPNLVRRSKRHDLDSPR